MKPLLPCVDDIRWGRAPRGACGLKLQYGSSECLLVQVAPHVGRVD